MTIKLYNVTDDPKMIPKHLGTEHVYTGTLRSETDIMNPVIRLEMNTPTQYNYAYIPDFNRYYYIGEPVSIRSGLVEYQGRVDVLQSFYGQFVHCPMIASRSDSTYNPMLPDPERKFEQGKWHDFHRLKIKDVPEQDEDFSMVFDYVVVTVG